MEFAARFRPPALRMDQVGMFTPDGLKAVSDIWGSLEYRDKEDHHDGEKLTEQLLTRLHTEGLMLDTAEQEHGGTLYRDWQIPMYNLEFSLIPVSLEEREAEQERNTGPWSAIRDSVKWMRWQTAVANRRHELLSVVGLPAVSWWPEQLVLSTLSTRQDERHVQVAQSLLRRCPADGIRRTGC